MYPDINRCHLILGPASGIRHDPKRNQSIGALACPGYMQPLSANIFAVAEVKGKAIERGQPRVASVPSSEADMPVFDDKVLFEPLSTLLAVDMHGAPLHPAHITVVNQFCVSGSLIERCWIWIQSSTGGLASYTKHKQDGAWDSPANFRFNRKHFE